MPRTAHTAPLSHPQATELRIMSAGVDWLTATAPHDGRDVPLLDCAERLMARDELDGYEPKRWTWNSYTGWQTDGLTFGMREDGVIVRLSGALAHKHALEVINHAANITRIDCEVTARFHPARPKFGQEAHRRALAHFQAHDKAPVPAFHGSRGRLETLTLGSRASERYGRLYDKYAESGDEVWRDCWRWEVEVKAEPAARLARKLAHVEWPGPVTASYVHDFFATAGIAPPFSWRGARYDGGDTQNR